MEAMPQVAAFAEVETLRKPSTGLKHVELGSVDFDDLGRDTQKTQHGIETRMPDVWCVIKRKSRHSENPARD